MSLNTSISSSFNLLLNKTDADLGYVPRKAIGFVKVNGRCGASVGEENVVVSSGVLFQPFEEVKKDAFVIPISPQMSLAKQNYFHDSEAAINEQIKKKDEKKRRRNAARRILEEEVEKVRNRLLGVGQ
ncbi:ferritin-4, chloroplastic-like protein [Tanacetum coccineum]